MASKETRLVWRIAFYPEISAYAYLHNQNYESHARAMYIATNKMRTKKHAKDRRRALVYSVKVRI